MKTAPHIHTYSSSPWHRHTHDTKHAVVQHTKPHKHAHTDEHCSPHLLAVNSCGMWLSECSRKKEEMQLFMWADNNVHLDLTVKHSGCGGGVSACSVWIGPSAEAFFFLLSWGKINSAVLFYYITQRLYTIVRLLLITEMEGQRGGSWSVFIVTCCKVC